MFFMGKHKIPAIIFKATSIIWKISFQLMVCYRSHLVKLHAHFLPFSLKSTWKSCDSCLGRTAEPGWLVAHSDMERWGGAWSHHTPVNFQPGTRNPSGQRSHPDTAHLACRACWGQALCVRTLEIRVSLRYLLTRTFGQQKQEVVLSYIDFSLETPWRTAWAKVPGLGDETSPS